MKDPAFLFYPNDWIGGTMGMTFEEKGAYMELLMLQFNRGHMTIHMIGHVLGQQAGQLWDKIKDKFATDAEGRFYNVRLEEEKNKRKTYTESRNNNRKGKNQYTKNKEEERGHMTSHMENVNEDVNKDTISEEGGMGEEDFNSVPDYETFLSYAKEKEPSVIESGVRNKYDAWVSAKWHDGKGKKIKNWKAKLLHTMPYLPKDNRVIPIIGRASQETILKNATGWET